MSDVDMGAFWDERARENAPYFVDNRQRYAAPDLDAFWAAGDEAVDAFEAALGTLVAPGEHVVEIGCGIGRVTRVLAARAATVRALDVSAEMLARARELNPALRNVRWLDGDGTSLGCVPDASADGVFSHAVFQHLPDPEVTYGYVAEMGRVLRPGGWAAFQVSDDPSLHRSRTPLRAVFGMALGRSPRGTRHPAWVGSAIDVQRLRAVADAAGLDVTRVVGAGSQYCLVRLCR